MTWFKQSPTRLVVGALIGVALAAVALEVAGWKLGALLLALLIYEGWTLVNSYPNDTISEIIWTFAKRPMVPFIFGAGTAWAIQSGTVTNPWLIVAVGFLMGHFFFQRQEG
jgi:hypothetical protein